ncbi:MAG TPA: alpha/beta fold hydrolase [Brachybacterium sp.]|nr:alpha/beta fold hydrolase [Brachybacterium sp.]
MSAPAPPPPVTAEGMLPRGDQRIHWEESGTPDGVPTLYLHGGPGGRLTPGYRRNSPAGSARIIGLSQRGTGRSAPSAGAPGPVDLSAQTTGDLVADLEALRVHLGIEAWIVQGVSWGSTLALAYAQAHPDRALGLVLFAVTTTSRREVEWITEGVAALYPEAWDAFAALAEEVDEHARRFACLVTHYWAHDGFVADWAVPWGASPGSGLLGGMARLSGLPGVLIHGLRDVSGPALTAWELHRAWPGSELIVVEEEGHGGPRMAEHWRAAVSRLVDASRPGPQ